MKKNIKKQFIKIFKGKMHFVPLTLVVGVFFAIYLLSDVVTKHFFNWEERPYFEIEKVIVSCMLTAILTVITTRLPKIQCYFKLKSLLYNTLIRLYWNSNSSILCKIIESFINIIYKGDFIPIQAQSNIIREILSDLMHMSSGNSTTRLFIISGESHSGKTILSQKLVNDIFTQKEYLKIFKKYNRNIFYYDFSCLNLELEILLSNYANGYYKNSLIIFDNIHKMGSHQTKRLLNKMIMDPDKAVCTLMLTRDINNLLTGPLMSEIDQKKESHIICTANLSALRFDDAYDFSDEFNFFLKELDFNQQQLENNYIKFHLYYVYRVYLKNRNPSIKDLFFRINHKEYNSSVVKGFIFICCNVLFTGVVDKKIIKKFVPQKNSSFYLKSYINMGILNGFHGVEAWEYSMHEKTAQSYIAYICENDEGLKLCKEYFRFLYEHTLGELQYRYSIPFDELYQKNHFNNIINNGHFQSLRDDIIFIIKTFKLNMKKYNYELGVLNDRVGNFNFTKENILELYNEVKKPKYLILLLHSDHMMYYNKNFFDLYADMLKSKNVYIRFATNYWISHINMHQGTWNLTEYSDLCNILPNDLDSISNESYETWHVLRRYYFDCFRIYYLQGNNCYQDFAKLLKRTEKIKTYLKDKLNEFEIYEYKFIYAHYIHYELLFRYYVLDETYISSEELQMVQCDSVDQLTKKAINFYYKAYKYFYENGDKTYYYVLLRLCELGPEYVLLHIDRSIEAPMNLCEFTQDNYRRIIGIFDKFRDECGIKQNMLEYAAYAETYKMKFAIMCRLTCSDIDLDFDSTVETAAQEAIKYHEQYNSQHPNNYGILRVNLLNAMNHFLSSHDNAVFNKKLGELKAICIDKKYNRELGMIKIIENMEMRQRIKRLHKIIEFYPIVLQ